LFTQSVIVFIMLYVNSIFEASCHCYYYRRSFNFVLCKIYFSNYIAYGYFFSIAHFGCFRLHAWPDMRIQVRPCKVMFLLISDVFSIMSSNIYYGKIIFDNFRVLLRVKNDQKLWLLSLTLCSQFLHYSVLNYILWQIHAQGRRILAVQSVKKLKQFFCVITNLFWDFQATPLRRLFL